MNRTAKIATAAAIAAGAALAAPTAANAATGGIQSRCAATFTHTRIIAACEQVQRTSPGFTSTGHDGRDTMQGVDASGTGWLFIVNDSGYHKAVETYSFG